MTDDSKINQKKEESEQDFLEIIKEERKRLIVLNKQINRTFWQIEKEEQLNDGEHQERIKLLNKKMLGLLDAYDKIVKRLTDLREKAPEVSEGEEGWKKEIIGLIEWAKDGKDKHAMMIIRKEKETNDYNNNTAKKTSLLADFGRESNTQATQRRSHIRRLD
jgi:hypothetical protein